MSIVDEPLVASLAGGNIAERAALGTALASPWCWPDEGDARLPSFAGLKRPRPLAVGEALLLSVAVDAGRASLHRLRLGESPPQGAARDAVELETLAATARRVVTRGLPALLHPERLAQPSPWRTDHVLTQGFGRTTHLSDVSFGLSFALAQASWVLGIPVPVDLAASATVAEDGTLGHVGAIDRKGRLVAHNALAVRRLLVHKDDAEEARSALGPSDGLEVVVVCSVAEAFAAAFPTADVERAIDALTPNDAARVADGLFKAALDGDKAILGWDCVATAANRLEARLDLDADAHWRAKTACAIAHRHGGQIAWIGLDWMEPGSHGLGYKAWLRYAAHWLQAHTDGTSDSSALAAAIERATTALSSDPNRACDDELKLRGAVGRALLVLGRHPAAVAMLRPTVAAWLDGDTPAEACRPLCALLQAIGHVGQAAGIRDLARAVTKVAASGSHVDRAFLTLDEGRAWWLCGDSARAFERLDDGAVWREAPTWLEPSRRRLRALALDLAGRRDEADAERAAVRADPDAAEYAALTALDAALRYGASDQELMSAVEAVQAVAQGVAALVARGGTAHEVAARVSRGFAY